MSRPQVLIVGAGPTGLVLALWLARASMPFRLIDRNSGPGQASRAMGVQSRTLEFYRQLGIADEVAAAGFRLDRIRVRNRSRELAVALLGEIGGGISPFPFVLSLPQDDHERLLTERLHAAGHAVEWDTELAGFAQRDDGVSATPRKPGGEEAVALRGSRAEVEELMSANAPIRTSVAPMLSVRQGARAVEFYKAAFESA